MAARPSHPSDSPAPLVTEALAPVRLTSFPTPPSSPLLKQAPPDVYLAVRSPCTVASMAGRSSASRRPPLSACSIGPPGQELRCRQACRGPASMVVLCSYRGRCLARIRLPVHLRPPPVQTEDHHTPTIYTSSTTAMDPGAPQDRHRCGSRQDRRRPSNTSDRQAPLRHVYHYRRRPTRSANPHTSSVLCFFVDRIRR